MSLLHVLFPLKKKFILRVLETNSLVRVCVLQTVILIAFENKAYVIDLYSSSDLYYLFFEMRYT